MPHRTSIHPPMSRRLFARPSARALSAVALAVSLLLSLRAPARADEAAGAEPAAPVTKEFKDKNFSVTLPVGWQPADPSEADKANGFVMTARRVVKAGVEATAYVLVRDAGGASVQANLTQVKDNKTRSLKDVQAKEDAVRWAGAQDAHMLKILGKAENGSTIAWFVYAGVVDGKYTQLDVRAVNGAHHDIGPEIDSVIQGFHFLAGAKAEEDGAPAPVAPAAGLSKRFEKQGITWTLPKPPETPNPEDKRTWGWRAEGNVDLALNDAGRLATASLDDAGQTVILIAFEMPKSSGGVMDQNPIDSIKNDGNFKQFSEDFDGTPIPNIDEDTKIGNVRGGSRSLTGKNKDGRPLYRRVYAVGRRKQLYWLIVTALDKAEQTQKEWLKDAIGGLNWDDTAQGLRAPWVVPFRDVSEGRGSEWLEVNEKKPFASSAVKLVKPATFARIKFTATEQPFAKWVYAAEERKPDVYCFVGIEKYDAAQFSSQKPPKEFDTLVDDHESKWKNEMGDPVTRPKSEKSNRSPTTFQGAKGFTYDFTGTKNGIPFVEHGWVVKAGPNIVWVHVQFGGKDAEKALGDDWNALKKSIKFD